MAEIAIATRKQLALAVSLPFVIKAFTKGGKQMITKEERRRISWENAQKCRKPNKYSVIDGVAHVILSNTKNIMLCDAEDWEN